MTFVHEFLKKPELTRIEINGKRHYRLDGTDKVFPSVTTVLKGASDTRSLDAWRARVGAKEADRVSGQARNRGTSLHAIVEKFLLNDPQYARGFMPTDLFLLKQIKPILEENVTEIYGLEFPLYSEKLNTAGTTDCLARWKRRKAVLDFKTSRREKKEEWIQDYFLQETVYAEMANELFDLGIEDIVTIILVDHSSPQIFEKKVADYRERVIDVFAPNSREESGLAHFNNRSQSL